MPRIGYVRPALTGNRCRWYTFSKWIVIYDPVGSPITILRVLHSAQELDRILDED